MWTASTRWPSESPSTSLVEPSPEGWRSTMAGRERSVCSPSQARISRDRQRPSCRQVRVRWRRAKTCSGRPGQPWAARSSGSRAQAEGRPSRSGAWQSQGMAGVETAVSIREVYRIGRFDAPRELTYLDSRFPTDKSEKSGRMSTEELAAAHRELGRELAARDERIRQLEGELESWRWDATTARRELSRLQTSRLWRVANLYWGLRRRLGLARKTAAPSAAAGPSAAGEEPSLPPGFPRAPAGRYDVVVFSIIDWDFRFQRPQQIATQLGRHGHRVFYLSTSRFLPMGGPAWSAAWKAKNVVELCLRSRRRLDVYGGRLEESDLAVLEEAVADLLESLALGDVIALVQIPFWAPLAGRLRERFGWRVVYDCMDEWTSFPGFGAAVLGLEEGLVRAADLTVVTARRLHEKLEPQAPRLLLAVNGVDGEHYRRHYGENDLLGKVRHPVIGYYGALASWVDVELIGKIARHFPQATFVLAGGAFDVDLAAVERLPNVRLLGARPYEEMPRLLWHFDACVIPFLVNDITQATNPVKFYEYLSAGKPVVAPRLDELLPYADLCYLADGHDAFLAALESALAEPADDPRRER